MAMCAEVTNDVDKFFAAAAHVRGQMSPIWLIISDMGGGPQCSISFKNC